MNTQTEYGKQVESLVGKCFTDKFKNNEITLDVLLDKLKLNVERTDIYDDGGILAIPVDLNEHNKTILSEIIQDFEAYNELIELEFHSDKKENQTDLCSILDYSERNLTGEVIYDWESKTFNYRHNE